MKLSTLMLTPWRATAGSSRWTVLVVMVLCLAVSIAVRLFVDDAHAWQIATLLYSFGVGFLFLMFSGVLPMAMDARRLRMPGVERAAAQGLLLYAALAIATAAIVLSPDPGRAPTVALLVALAIAGVLAFVLLPRYLSIPLVFVPSVGLKLWHAAHLPMPGQPGFASIGAAILVVLVLADARCWQRLLSGRWKGAAGMRGPSVMTFHRVTLGGDWSGLSQQTDSRLLRQRPDWLQVRADLRGVGPAAPVRTLRVALGGWYLPQTFASQLRQWFPVALMLLAFALVQFILDPRHGVLAIWSVFGTKGVVGMIVMITVILAALMPFALQQRWQRVNAELPLLALMPGLGNDKSVRAHLLRACLVKPLVVVALALVAVLGMGIAMHATSIALVLLAAPIVICAAFGAAMLLCIFGGRPLHGWASFALSLVAFCLLCIGTLLPLITMGSDADTIPASVFVALSLAWIAFGAVLYGLGLRGWRGLERRPHPFLANER